MKGIHQPVEGHDICLMTDFCRKCGNHRETIQLCDFLCAEGETVVGMNHLRRLQVMGELSGAKPKTG